MSCPRQLIETVKSMANTMLFRQLTFERQMVTFSLLTIRGVSRHSFIQVPMWRKGPNDHLPLVWTTMGCTLLKCAEGALAFVAIRKRVRGEFHYREGVDCLGYWSNLRYKQSNNTESHYVLKLQ